MITTRPDVALDGLYNQSQAAKALGVDRHTVKRYETNGFLKFKSRKVNFSRVTTGRQIISCWEKCFL